MTSQDAFDSGSLPFSDSIVTVLPATNAVKASSSVPKDFPIRNFSHRRYLVVSATSHSSQPSSAILEAVSEPHRYIFSLLEPRQEPAGGCSAHFRRRPALHDLASPQNRDPIRDLQCAAGSLGRVDHRPAAMDSGAGRAGFG